MVNKPIGILILHGFAASLDSVNMLDRQLQLSHLPVSMPVLRGHGAASPEALKGVMWRDWVSDAERAMRGLLNEAKKVIIIGHGMGGLLALILAANNRDSIDSLVLAAPSIELPNPVWTQIRLQVLQPMVQQTFRRWSLPPDYTDRKQRKTDSNYHWAPMDTILSFFELIEMTRTRLKDVSAPLLIIQSKRDATVSLDGPKIIRAGIATPPEWKQIKWFTQSGHELFRDIEREEVTNTVVHYVMERVDRHDIHRNGNSVK